MKFVPITDFPNYEISHDGYVRSVDHRGWTGRVLRANNRGWVALHQDGKSHWRKVSVLIEQNGLGDRVVTLAEMRRR